MIDIREIILADKQEYQQVVHLAYQAAEQMGIHFAAATADLATIEAHINSNLVYGLFSEGKLVSTVSLRLPWGNNPSFFGVPHIGWFATDPRVGKKGFGVQLLNWVEAEVLTKQLKLPFVTLGTAANHLWLNQFYQKQGYEEIECRDLTDDHTTIFYRKILNPSLFAAWQAKHKK